MSTTGNSLSLLQTFILGFLIVGLVFANEVWSARHPNSDTRKSDKVHSSNLVAMAVHILKWVCVSLITIGLMKILGSQILYSSILVIPIVSILQKGYELRKAAKPNP